MDRNIYLKKAHEIIEEALEVARSISVEGWRSEALSYVINAFVGAERIDEALEIARSISDKFICALALVKIAEVIENPKLRI